MRCQEQTLLTTGSAAGARVFAMAAARTGAKNYMVVLQAAAKPRSHGFWADLPTKGAVRQGQTQTILADRRLSEAQRHNQRACAERRISAGQHDI